MTDRPIAASDVETAAGDEAKRYRPIRDYAAIGDCHGSALVARDGSIDWCALRRFDADPVFCRILDAERGGYWSIRPVAPHRIERAYLGETNILRTIFETESGRVALTDLMPVGRRLDAGVHDYVHLMAPWWLIRRLDGLAGEVEMEVCYRPSRAFAREPVHLEAGGGRIAGEEVPTLFSGVEFAIAGDLARARLTLGAQERRDFVLAINTVEDRPPLARVDEFLEVTRAFWEEWIDYCRYDGEHRAMVRRSALTLKLMTYAPSGAMVAALTTSLPEQIGGPRNWDYRFSWLRDSCFTLYALSVLGYAGEAERFNRFLAGSIRRTLPNVRIMYGVGHEDRLDEVLLDHLEGYEGSRPVRIGNGAYCQRQMDVYGQVLDLALIYQRLGGQLGEQHQRLLRTLAEFVARRWQEPDQGLWEMRGAARHHVHGKMMSWVACDRAARLFEDSSHWRRLADRIERVIKERGIAADGGHFKQAYDGGVDAAVLLAPMLGFPSRQETMEATIDRIIGQLGQGDYLQRYDGPDGLPGEEGAFLICSFWLIDALLSVGRVDEAEARFGRLVRCANDVGLFAEEIEPGNGAFLGNFPQAFTHLAVIGSATSLYLVRRWGPKVLFGSYADRAQRVVTATFGWRGWLAAARQSRRVGRLRSSRRSKLAWP